MIIETLSYFFHSLSCPKYIRKIGLLKELVAIDSRAKRCSEAWQEHLNKTKQALITFSESVEPDSRLLVLGAGLLNDIPIKELSERFEEVILVDIFFLQSTINEIKRYPNLSFEEFDITGVLEIAYQAYLLYKEDKDIVKLDERLKNLTSLKPYFKLNDYGLTHVASVNLLSQLALSIKGFFEAQDIELGENFYQSFVSNHIEYLKEFSKLGKKVLLITDVEKEVLDLNSRLKLSESSIEGLELEDFDLTQSASWDWDLAPKGEIDKKYSLKLRVELCRI